MKKILFLSVLAILLVPFGDVCADQWQELNPPVKPPGLSGHTMAAFDGTVYLFGGNKKEGGTSVPINELWQWVGSDWAKLSEGVGPEPRANHSAAAYEQANYIFFGADAGDQALADIWGYNTVSGLWSQAPSGPNGPGGRFYHSSVAISDGHILILGGMKTGGIMADNFVWSYDPATGAWEKKSAYPAAWIMGHGPR